MPKKTGYRIKGTLIPLIYMLLIAGIGLTAMILGAKFNLDWCKEISFFMFGAATSPLHSAMQYFKNGTKTSARNTVAKCLIAGTIGAGVSFAACTPTNIDPNCAMDAIQKCYNEAKQCMEDNDTEPVDD